MDYKSANAKKTKKAAKVMTKATGATPEDKMPSKKSTPAPKDPVFEKFGPPFLVNDKNTIVLNDRAVAVKCATRHQVRYDTINQRYERYESARGLWLDVHEVEVARMLDDLLLELGQKYEQQAFVSRITAAKLSALARMMRPHNLKIQPESTAGLVHVANGVLALDGHKLKLLAHDSKYLFRHSSGIPFKPKAGCPKFIKKLLEPSLGKEDIALVQKYCGSMLLGGNSCHGILVIRGTAGGGKSTLVSIIEKIIGEHQVAYLRTAHLGERFETSAFLGKRLLVGKDVPGDTLAVGGARMLKSLVGGDLMQAEIKFNPDKRAVRGDFHVIIVSNNQLRIALDGDEDAWSRRLLVVDFKNPKPTHPIPNFAEILIADEASGILNWLLEGAAMYSDEMKELGLLHLSEEQAGRIDSLLENSDNLPAFVNRCVAEKKGADVSSEELLLGYYRICKSENWTPVSSHAFQSRVPDLLAQLFRTTRRNDIARNGKAVRGFKNVSLS